MAKTARLSCKKEAEAVFESLLVCKLRCSPLNEMPMLTPARLGVARAAAGSGAKLGKD